MPDSIVLVAPLALLAIVLLLRFVGCSFDSSAPPVVDGTGWNYGQTVLDDGPVSYWRLGEPVGPTANDELGAHPGTYQTAPLPAVGNSPATAAPPVLTFGADGLIVSDPARTCVQVDGGYVEVPFSASLNTPQFTIEAWVVPEWPAGESGFFRSVVSSREGMGAGPLRGCMLYAGPDLSNPGDPTTYWQAWVGDGGSAWQTLLGPAVEANQKVHLAVTYDGTTLKLYVNGSVDSAGTPDAQLATGFSANTGAPLYIGMGAPEQPTPSFPFKGRLQEVAVYNTALSATDVDNHVVAGATTGP